jgi:50S ribosomal protein L16 3-hydroxylase
VRRGYIASMLAEWLAPLDVATFLRTHLQRQPYARPGTAAAAVALFGWPVLEKVLRSPFALDLLTVKAGQLVAVERPGSLDDVRALMRLGVSVVVRASEHHDPGLAQLAASFSEALPGEVHIQLYTTPGGTNSYGWHYDFEDVFVVQTLGCKDYYFRDNTVARNSTLGDRLDFTVMRQETSPIYSAQLLPGDWLYIPARWWHLVKCREDALSISIGVMPPGPRGSHGPGQTGSCARWSPADPGAQDWRSELLDASNSRRVVDLVCAVPGVRLLGVHHVHPGDRQLAWGA